MKLRYRQRKNSNVTNNDWNKTIKSFTPSDKKQVVNIQPRQALECADNNIKLGHTVQTTDIDLAISLIVVCYKET